MIIQIRGEIGMMLLLDGNAHIARRGRYEQDHVQCVPKRSLLAKFAQVRAVQPEVCKTVG
jgi:hypothetical protein